MLGRNILGAAICGSAALLAAPVIAQDVEGDANSPVVQWGRMLSEPGSFWLDSNDDVEVIRYTSSRDVSLCLPEPTGVYAAQQGYPLTITWDETNTAVLRPGNCLFFDARVVRLKPTNPLPTGVTLSGRVQTESALQRGN